jgi:hypothetical protein
MKPRVWVVGLVFAILAASLLAGADKVTLSAKPATVPASGAKQQSNCAAEAAANSQPSANRAMCSLHQFCTFGIDCCGDPFVDEGRCGDNGTGKCCPDNTCCKPNRGCGA